jgi:nifR3 family TIM-barrel protein
MKIGAITLDHPTLLAPLAGISNLPMRLMAKSAGCALVYTEMVSANGLVHSSAKTQQLLASVPEERPLAVQLFGGDAALLAEAARQVAAAGADIVDLNFGCAVKKILKSGSGVALMADLQHAERVLRAVRRAVDVPLTIKMRSGWEPSGNAALALGRLAQDCGVDAVALHPRTARQGFAGRADWALIARLKAALGIPVIGNGDIASAEDAARMLTQTGCDAVMIGRAAIGNPYIFSQITDVLEGRPPQIPAPADRFRMMRAYAAATVKHLGASSACFMLRSQLGWFAKGLPQASQFRAAIHTIASGDEAHLRIDAYEALMAEADRCS